MIKLLQFGASYCSPCKRVSKIMDELEEDGYSVQYIDVDDNQFLANEYSIKSVPVVVIEVRGEPMEYICGLHSKAEYIEAIKRWDK